MKLHGCPYALRDAIYQDCPRLVHGLPGKPCDGCCAETAVDLQDVTPAALAGTLPSTTYRQEDTMEGSQTPGDQGTPEAEGEGQARTDAFGQPLAEGQAGEGTVEGAEPSAAPVESASDEERLSDLPHEDRNPAEDQAPAATGAQDVVVGDPGLRDESQPVGSVGNPDQPVRTSAPPPSAQSGVPLPEDRAAGVQPGTSGPAVAGGDELDEDEAPDHDGSEGQSTTPPSGG